MIKMTAARSDERAVGLKGDLALLLLSNDAYDRSVDDFSDRYLRTDSKDEYPNG
jgi:hypothetical protein